MPYWSILIVIGCVSLYYKVGEEEHGSGILLALISLVLWVAGSFALGLGWLGNLLVQVGLFLALTCWNMWRRSRQ